LRPRLLGRRETRVVCCGLLALSGDFGAAAAILERSHVTPPPWYRCPACSLLSPRSASPRIQQAAGTPQAARSMRRIFDSFGRFQDRGPDEQIAAPFLCRPAGDRRPAQHDRDALRSANCRSIIVSSYELLFTPELSKKP